MRKKLKEYFCRFLSVLLCISIFCVFVVSPVSAADYSLNLIDLLQYQTSLDFISNDTGTYYYIDLAFPSYTNVYYLEYYYYCYGDFTPNIQIGSNILGVSNIPLGNGLFKSYFKR